MDHRQRRSTRATRVAGFLAYAFGVLVVVPKLWTYWSPPPRWDVVTPLVLSGLFAFAWLVLSWRAPRVPVVGSRAVDGVVLRRGPALPESIPFVEDGRNVRRDLATAALACVAVLLIVETILAPSGSLGRRLDRLIRAGAIRQDVSVVQVVGVPGWAGCGKGCMYSTSHVVVEVPFGRGAQSVDVPHASSARSPEVGSQMHALFAPSRPDLGVLVFYRDPRPVPNAAVSWGFAVGFLLVCATVGLKIMQDRTPSLSRDATALLRKDYADRKIGAARAVITGSGRVRRIQKGKSLGSEIRVNEAPYLTMSVAGGGTWEVRPVSDADPSAIADDFAGIAGWLVWKEIDEVPR